MNKIDNTQPASVRHWMRWLLLALICAIFALALTSCSTGARATRDDAAQVNRPPPPPPPGLQANQRTTCPDLPQPASDAALALIANHDQVTAQYDECRDRVDSILESAGEWQATAWRWYCQAVDAMGIAAEGCKGK